MPLRPSTLLVTLLLPSLACVPQEEGGTQWEVIEEIDEFDGSRTLLAGTVDTNDENQALLFTCAEGGRMNVQILFGRPLLTVLKHGQPISLVDVKTDEEEVVTEVWHPQGVGAVRPRDQWRHAEFLAALSGADTLRARTTLASGESTTATILLAGMDEALTPLRELCP